MQYDKKPCPYCGELIGINNICYIVKIYYILLIIYNIFPSKPNI